MLHEKLLSAIADLPKRVGTGLDQMSMRNVQQVFGDLLDEVCDDVYSFPVLSEGFCAGNRNSKWVLWPAHVVCGSQTELHAECERFTDFVHVKGANIPQSWR